MATPAPTSVILQNDTFKFVSVRPPNLADSTTGDQVTITDPRTPDNSEVLTSVTNMIATFRNTGRNNREPNANRGALLSALTKELKSIIKKRNYSIADFDSNAAYIKTYSAFQIVKDKIAGISSDFKEDDKTKLTNDIEADLGSSLSNFVQTSAFTTLESGLWERLYAFHVINRSTLTNVDPIVSALQALHTIQYFGMKGIPDFTGTKLLLRSVPILPNIVQKLSTDPLIISQWMNPPQVIASAFPAAPNYKYIGLGDLLVVKQKLKKFQMGEIADIENVLLGETKNRNHRRLERTEETTTSETQTIEFKEKDNQTTERFELKHEADKTIKSDMEIKAGVTVSGKFGPVEISANTSFGLSNSSEESTKNASNYAKDVVDRSVSSIQTNVKETRSRKTLLEIEEINSHGFVNPAQAGNTNISGIYRWVDKLYEAQIYKYGVRNMFEFIIPEPAAFYIYSQLNKPPQNYNIDSPPNFTLNNQPFDAQNNKLITASDITFVDQAGVPPNYLELASRFGVSGVTPPPERFVYVTYAKSDFIKDPQKDFSFADNAGINIPDGYTAISYFFQLKVETVDDGWWGIVNLGRYWFWRDSNIPNISAIDLGSPFRSNLPGVNPGQMGNETGMIPIGIQCGGVVSAYLTVTITCEWTNNKVRAWQLKTFDSLYTSWFTWKSDYETKIRAAKSEDEGKVVITGRNPGINRQIERNELKKACIAILAEQYYEKFNAIKNPSAGQPYPEIDTDESGGEGQVIQFFEQCFEWEQMTYLFYPYFWSRKETWIDRINYDDTDALFTKFLQAGSCRVVLPVINEAYFEAFLYYLEHKNDPAVKTPIWHGGTTPGLNDPLFISLAAEVRAQDDPTGEPIPVGNAWEVIIPTSLVYLQKGYDLPDFTTS